MRPNLIDWLPASLKITSESELVGLPSPIYVKGDVSISNCKTVPPIHSKGDVHITNCITVQSINAEGCISIQKCPTLKELPEGLRSKKSIFLGYLPKLIALPDGLCAGTDLSLFVCENLCDLSRSWQSKQDLHISECHKVIEVPNGANGPKFGGGITFNECNGEIVFPDKTLFKGDVLIYWCPNLKIEQDELEVRGDFKIFSSIVKGTALPRKVHVSKNCSIVSCRNPFTLPTELSVGKKLLFMECPWVKKSNLPTQWEARKIIVETEYTSEAW